MFLFLDDDFAQGFGEGEFAHGFGLADALAIVGDGFAFVIQIEAEHVLGFVGHFDWLGRGDGRAAEVIDLLGDFEGVIEFFGSVGFEFASDVGEGGAFDHFAVNDVGDDGLVFARKVLVEEFDHAFA